MSSRSDGRAARRAAGPVARLEAETLAVVQDPAVAARILASGILPQAMPGEKFGRSAAEATRRLAALVRVAGIRAD